MSDHYVKVKVQLEQMKSFGEDAGKEGVDTGERPPGSSPPAPASPDPSGTAGDEPDSPAADKHRGKSRSDQGKDDKNASDPSLHGSVVSAHFGKNSNRLGHQQTLHVRGTGKMLQGKSEANGNYVTIHAPRIVQEARREDGLRHARRRRPVAVDTSKAKTSLEAVKMSIRQLKWKEVCKCSSFHFFFLN